MWIIFVCFFFHLKKKFPMLFSFIYIFFIILFEIVHSWISLEHFVQKYASHSLQDLSVLTLYFSLEQYLLSILVSSVWFLYLFLSELLRYCSLIFKAKFLVPNFFLISLAELFNTVAFVIDACTSLIQITHVYFFDRTIGISFLQR